YAHDRGPGGDGEAEIRGLEVVADVPGAHGGGRGVGVVAGGDVAGVAPGDGAHARVVGARAGAIRPRSGVGHRRARPHLVVDGDVRPGVGQADHGVGHVRP